MTSTKSASAALDRFQDATANGIAPHATPAGRQLHAHAGIAGPPASTDSALDAVQLKDANSVSAKAPIAPVGGQQLHARELSALVDAVIRYDTRTRNTTRVMFVASCS